MGLFSKEPAERKAYWKAFDSACSKPGEKTFPALEAACKGWPSGWQGYLLMALCYDLGSGVPFDTVKAAEYHYKAKEAARKTNNEWVDIFYEYYDESVMNFRCKEDYFARTQNVRKAGVAMIFSYYINECGILGDHGKKDDLKFWKSIFDKVDTGSLFKMSDEQAQVMYHKEPFTQWIFDFDWYNNNADEKTIIDFTNKIIKKNNKLLKVEKDKVDTSFIDMWLFNFAMSCFFGGRPYRCDGEDWYKNPRVNGWRYFWHAAFYGCAAAIHVIGTYWNDENFHDEIVFAATTVIRNVTTEKEAHNQIMILLEECGVKGDKRSEELFYELNKLTGTYS